MSIQYEPSILDYLSIIRRRAPYIAGIFVSVLLIAVIYAFTVKPIYRATGTILAESKQISEELGSSAIKSQLDDQINIIIQKMMTRENLLAIAHKYKLFPGNIASLTTTEIADRMRSRIDIEKGGDEFQIETSRYRNPNSIAFSLSFEDKSPEVAFQATNDLIALFMETSDKLRNEGATETTQFLDTQTKQLKDSLDAIDKKIAKYKSEHSNALPEQLTMRMNMLDRAQNDLLEVERDYRSTREELRSLDIELMALNQGLGDTNVPQTLPALKAEYARLLTIYNESYPDVRELKRKIQIMEKHGRSPASGVASITTPSSLAAYKVQSKIDADNARLRSITQQRQLLQRKIAEYETALTETPNVEQGLAVLLRDRDSAQKKYEEIRNNQMNAQIAQNLVSGDKGGYFSILEAPVLPDVPKSKRMKIVGLGFILAIASSLGGVFALESINKRVRGSEELAQVLGNRPLVVIPYISTREDDGRKKINRAISETMSSLKQKLWWVADLKRKFWWVGDLKRKLWG
jgi:polysaccharide chain length determinant protein (PEP-CTERM system associated)